MTEPDANQLRSQREAKVPRRDWLLLPMLGLLTICVIAGSVELIARRMFTREGTEGEDCMVFNDPVTGARGIPNSVCWEKIPEGELTEYRFNSCGHRAGMECGPKPADTYRIVMIGTSFSIGMRVPREKTFAALLPLELSRQTRRKVELYNESMPFKLPDTIAVHFNDVLKAEPDMVLWALTDRDIESQSEIAVPPVNRHLSLPAKAWHRLKTTIAGKSFTASISEIFSHTRTATLLSHILYASQSQYVKASLIQPDDKVGYLRAEPSVEWRKRLNEFDMNAAKIAAQARDAGVPLVAVLLPNHAQAAMISMEEWPAGFDPYKLDEELRLIITSHGGTYIDMLPDMRMIHSPELGYFPVEGHPNALGHAIFSGLLAKELTSGAVPALRVADQSQAAAEQGR
jgi:hypothetical protein